jgi:hypothetical protein
MKLNGIKGPIVRINPDEIHIADPEFYDTIYAGSGRKRDKWDWITRSFGVDESLIGTLKHDEHRVRRASLSPYFSKQSVRALQPLIDRNMGILLERLRQFADSGSPLKLDDAYAALTNGETLSLDSRNDWTTDFIFFPQTLLRTTPLGEANIV